MGKKVDAYQANDGTLFTGKDAKKNMELHERLVEAGNRAKEIVKYARKVFGIPKVEDLDLGDEHELFDDETTQKEQDFMEQIGENFSLADDYYFDDLITWIMRMKAYNGEAFHKLILAIDTNEYSRIK